MLKKGVKFDFRLGNEVTVSLVSGLRFELVVSRWGTRPAAAGSYANPTPAGQSLTRIA